MSLLDVENLTLQFRTDEGIITAVDNVSFSLEPGEVMGGNFSNHAMSSLSGTVFDMASSVRRRRRRMPGQSGLARMKPESSAKSAFDVIDL